MDYVLQYRHHLDGCVRQGNWLNMSLHWEMEVQELRPCYQDVQPGSYFAGAGFAVFNISGGNFDLEVDRRKGQCCFHTRKRKFVFFIQVNFFLLSSLFSEAFPFEAEGNISIELSGNFSKMDGTILSIKPLGQERMFSLVANNETKVCSLIRKRASPNFSKIPWVIKTCLKCAYVEPHGFDSPLLSLLSIRRGSHSRLGRELSSCRTRLRG